MIDIKITYFHNFLQYDIISWQVRGCMNDVTEDFILNGKLKLKQPKHGYRIAIDPVILAHVVEVYPGQSVLDVGCGVGTVSLILKKRNPSQYVDAIDIDPFVCRLCEENARDNDLSITVHNQSVETALLKKRFDCIVTNPPFYDPKNFRISQTKTLANFETVPLDVWINFCIRHLKHGGRFYIIHIPERLSDILDCIKMQLGKIEITPIYAYKNQKAKKIIVEAKKGSNEQLKFLPPKIIHNDRGEFSPDMANILNG